MAGVFLTLEATVKSISKVAVLVHSPTKNVIVSLQPHQHLKCTFCDFCTFCGIFSNIILIFKN